MIQPIGKSGLVSSALLLCLLQNLGAQEPPPNGALNSQELSRTADFIRMTESADGQPLTLDTAVVSYYAAGNNDPAGTNDAGSNNVRVDLIGAVHIGEASYYASLNDLFQSYDVLLYELVAPEGTVIERNARRSSDNPISFLQNATKNFLGMESQLEQIDYTRPNFIRADMTPDQLQEKMQSRGENVLTLAMSALLDAMRQQNQAVRDPKSAKIADSNMDLMEMLQNPKKAKITMARQFAGTESLDLALGSSLNQLLVVDRNAEALKVLKQQLDQGHRTIGVFYGAAHLPDLELHLVKDFGLTKKETRWVKAWDLTQGQEPTQQLDPISAMLNLLKEVK